MPPLDKTLARIIADIAMQVNIDPAMVQEIVRSQFTYVARIMRQGGFDAIMLPRLGKFRVKPNRPRLLSKQTMRKNRNKQNGVFRDPGRHANNPPGSTEH